MSFKFAGFDTETVGDPAKFLCFSYYSPKEQCVSFDISELRRLFVHSKQGFKFFAHNAEFDFLVIQDWLKRNFDLEVRYNKSRFICAKVARHRDVKEVKGKPRRKSRWFLLDTLNFYPHFRLADIGKLLNIPKLERPPYLGKRSPKPEELEYFKRYSLQDARICYEAMKLFYQKFDVRYTLPSTALRYQHNTGVNFDQWVKPFRPIHEKFRAAYHGARTEAFYRGMISKDDFQLFDYDINSMYPFVMSTLNSPDLTYSPKERFDFDRVGVAHAEVKPDCDLPLLALKKEKLLFPSGKFEGWFTLSELEAFQNEGKILTVKECWSYPPVESPFKKFVSELFELREDERFYLTAKLMLNSGYGKYGELVRESKLLPFETVERLTVAQRKQMIPYLQMLGDENWFIYNSDKVRLTPHTFFPICAEITAQARILLHRWLHCAGEVFYCDTDGFICSKRLPLSKQLGGLKLVNEYNWFLPIRAKFYLSDKNFKLKGARGLNRVKILEGISKGKLEGEFNKFSRMRESLRRRLDFLSWIKVKKNFDLTEDGKRIYNKKLRGSSLLGDYTASRPLQIARAY